MDKEIEKINNEITKEMEKMKYFFTQEQEIEVNLFINRLGNKNICEVFRISLEIPSKRR